MRSIGVLLILLFALVGPAAAQTANPAPPVDAPVVPDAKTLAANYELSSATGDRKCPVTLDLKPTGPGFTLVYDKTVCLPLFGFLRETVAWVPGIAGSIRFINATKHTVSEFTEGVGGQYEALREGDGVYFLANLQFVDPGEAPQFADLVGEWNLLRPGGPPICGITLTDQQTGDDTYILTVKPGCDQAIIRFGPIAWILDRGDIIFFSQKGERLRFGRQQEGGWAKVPEMPRPLLLARP